jgi:hypothetical protein
MVQDSFLQIRKFSCRMTHFLHCFQAFSFPVSACRPPVETIVTQNARGWGDPPPAAVSKVASIAQRLQTTNYSMKLPKALCGKVSNVVIWEDPHWALVTEHAPVGTFLRLRNIDVRRWQQNQFRCKSFYCRPLRSKIRVLAIVL